MTSFGPMKQSVLLLPFVTVDKRKCPRGMSEKWNDGSNPNVIWYVKIDIAIWNDLLIHRSRGPPSPQEKVFAHLSS